MNDISTMIFVTAISAYLFRFRGDDTLKKYEWIILTASLCFAFNYDEVVALCWIWVYTVFGVFPTQSLFTAIHGRLPLRNDHKYFHWMQRLCTDFKGKFYGIFYGFIRGSLCTPAFIIMSALQGSLLPYLFLLLACSHGLIYYFFGLFGERLAVKHSERLIGSLIGLGIVLQ